MNTTAAIDLILSHGDMKTTYKLAVLRALVDIVIEHPAQEPRNGFHLIPAIELARRSLAYYWKPELRGVIQARPTRGKPAIIPGEIRKLIEHGRLPGFPIPLNLDHSGACLADWTEGAPTLPEPLIAALMKIRKTLFSGPLRHLPVVGSRRVEVFNLLTRPKQTPDNLAPWLSGTYQEHWEAASRSATDPRATTWRSILDWERTLLVLSARAYEEISAYRFWLRDAILMRWMQKCEAFSSAPVPPSAFDLDLPGRSQSTITRLKSEYDRLHWRTCIYTGSPLRGAVHLDHILPFSRFPVDRFWNLVPTTAKLNGQKAARIPLMTAEIKGRYCAFLDALTASPSPHIAEDMDWTWRKYFQSAQNSHSQTARPTAALWSIMEASLDRLEQAGVDLWEPATA